MKNGDIDGNNITDDSFAWAAWLRQAITWFNKPFEINKSLGEISPWEEEDEGKNDSKKPMATMNDKCLAKQYNVLNENQFISKWSHEVHSYARSIITFAAIELLFCLFLRRWKTNRRWLFGSKRFWRPARNNDDVCIYICFLHSKTSCLIWVIK